MRRSRVRIDWPTAAGALFFILLGGGFGGFGGWQVLTTYSFLSSAAEVPAVVEEQNENCDDDSCTYWPMLAFAAPDGQQLSLKTQFGSSAYGFSEGANIVVLYNPAYNYVRIGGKSNLWLLGGVFFFLGGLVFCIGVLLLAKITFSRQLETDQ